MRRGTERCGEVYHWTHLPRPLGAKGPSIILCVKKWSLPAPQPRGSSHSPEGKNGRVQLITTDRRGYKKILLVGFKDIYDGLAKPVSSRSGETAEYRE